MASLPDRRWVLVGLLVAAAFADALATPYLPLPVGTATATGASMGHEGMGVLVYAAPALPGVSVAVGDPIIYATDGRYVHHRVVGVTESGYLTRGDAVPVTDQSLGAPAVTRGMIVGEVVLRVPLSVAWWLAAGLAGALVALGFLIRQSGPPAPGA